MPKLNTEAEYRSRKLMQKADVEIRRACMASITGIPSASSGLAGGLR
jgi:hypothetical protein